MIRGLVSRVCGFLEKPLLSPRSNMLRSASGFNLTYNLYNVNRNICENPFNVMSLHSNRLLPVTQTPLESSTRSLTKFSLQSGKRQTVRAVLKRFYRLDWGIWIRGKCGRNKKLSKKSNNRKLRLRQHVFTSASQSHLLDKMVSKYWKKPKYFVDDPYNPYHKREEFPYTRKSPMLP